MMRMGNLALQDEVVTPTPVAIAQVGALLVPFVGVSKWTKSTWERLGILAMDEQPLAFVGESGSGKTYLARHAHWRSPRASGPLHIINLRAMPVEIMEAELFGYSRSGLLGGSESPIGAVERASGGSLIVQGIERLPATGQERLLAWLLDSRVSPVGSEEVRNVNTRAVLEMRGRELVPRRGASLIAPLYALIEKQVIVVAPLHERRDDILPLVDFFLQTYADAWGMPLPELTGEVARLLKRAPWEENVRTLMRVTAQMLQEAKVGPITPHHLPPALLGRSTEAAAVGIEATALEGLVEEKLHRFFDRLSGYEVQELHDAVMSKVERPLIRLVLEQTHGNQVRAARMLGLNRNTLRTRLRKLGLEGKRRRSA